MNQDDMIVNWTTLLPNVKPNKNKDMSIRSSNWRLIATLNNNPFNKQKSPSKNNQGAAQ